ncbi:MAG: 1-(5-phosphoribosyl)-5-[(5-phosphoribosylamino)methylideneamino] imidazole-4-carboxamide isomerase [Pseudomonadota bacterium]
MMIYPTLELLGGRCVTLSRGNMDQPSIWHVDPLEIVRDWAGTGASWMHLTDFDGVDGRNDNADLVQEIILAAQIPVQLGGGFRTADGVAQWIDKGLGRVVIGTWAAQDPDGVKALAKRYPDQIVLSVAVWKGQVMLNGWRNASALSPETFLRAFADTPLAAVMITDIDSDIDDYDAQMGVISGLATKASAPVIASGVVRSLDDIARLKYIPGVDGAIVGRALFSKTFTLSDALEVAAPDREPVADFM